MSSLPSSSSSSPFSSSQSVAPSSLVELQKVFSVFDRDGSGTINAKELSGLLRQMNGNVDPSGSEIDSFMRLMDKNQDGIISFEEFVSSLSTWLNDADTASSLEISTALDPSIADTTTASPLNPRKRKDAPGPSATPSTGTSTTTQRSLLHKKIKMFFLQFKPRPDFEAIRKKLAEQMEQRGTTETKGDDTPIGVDDANSSSSTSSPPSSTSHASLDWTDPSYRSVTPADRLNALQQSSELIGQLHLIASGLNSNDPQQALHCCRGLGEIFSLLEVYRTPDERYEVNDIIITVFNRIGEASVLKRVIDFLGCNDMPELQYNAARILSLYCNGPRIAHTPMDSIHHPSKSYHKSRSIELGAAHGLIAALDSSTHPGVKEECLYALGCLAQYDSEARDLLISLGVLDIISSAINEDTDPSLLSRCTWIISIFCGNSHPPTSQLPRYELLKGILPKLAMLMSIKPEPRVLVHVLVSLNYLLPGVDLQELSMLVQSIVNYTGHSSLQVVEVSLKCILSMVTVDESSIPFFIECSLLLATREILRGQEDSTVRSLLIQLLQRISSSGNGKYNGDIVGADLISILISIFHADDTLRPRVLSIFLHLVKNSSNDMFYVFIDKYDIIKVVGNHLSAFKNYDTFLKTLYTFVGPSFNFDFLSEGLKILEIIVEKVSSDGSVEENPVLADKFDMEIINSLKDVLTFFCSEGVDAMDSWLKTSNLHGGISFEDRIRNILNKIQTIHEKSKLQGYDVIIKDINDIISNAVQLCKKNAYAIEKKRKQKALESKTGNYGGGSIAMSTSTSTSSGALYPSGGGNNSGSTSSISGNLIVKCFFNGDNRVLEVPGDITLKDLQYRIVLKYDRPIQIQFEDHDGDKITIDSQEIFQRALSTIDRTSNSIKFYLLPKGGDGGGMGGSSILSSFTYNPSGNSSNNNRYSNFFSANDNNNGGNYKGNNPNSIFSELQSRIHHGNNYNNNNNNNNGNNNGKSRNQLMKELMDVTKFDRKSLENLYKKFHQISPSGQLNQQQFKEGLKGFQDDDEAVKQLFIAFDGDKDNFISFQDFACGLSILSRGSMEERLHLAFKAYDLDGNGTIDRNELFHMYKASLMAKEMFTDDDAVQAMVDKTFRDADNDNDNRLNYQEFKQAAVKHQIIVQSFWGMSI